MSARLFDGKGIDVNMKHLGNISKIKGSEVDPVDVLTFGAPCQDLSVAGKQKGMQHTEKGDEETTRSGLFYEAIRIAEEMLAATGGEYPKFLIYENVPGAFSSNKGADFHAVLEEMCKIKDPAVSIPRPENGKWAKAGAIVGDSWSLAWRTHDAQFWGVPQRRRRISVVLDLRESSCAEILFEPVGLQWHPAPRGGAAQDAINTERNTGVAIGFDGYNQCLTGDTTQTIRADKSDGDHVGMILTTTIPINDKATRYKGGGELRNSDGSGNGLGVGKDGDPAPTLTAGDRHAVAAFMGGQGAKAGSIAYSEDVAPTLKSSASGTNMAPCVLTYDARGNGNGNVACKRTGDHQNRVTDYTALAVMPFDTTQITSPQNGCNPKYGDPCHPLCATAHTPAIVYTQKRFGEYEPGIGTLTAQGNHGNTGENLAVETYQNVTGPLMANSHPGSYSGQDAYTDMFITRNFMVRRLTPTECGRLQYYPDGWCDLPQVTDMSDEEVDFWNGVLAEMAEINKKPYKPKTKKQVIRWYNKLGSDSALYKAFGNSIALPFWMFLLERIADRLPPQATLGSLFDGIGGFPLIWERIQGARTALWASEVEPFPIAVTRNRFSGKGWWPICL